MAASLSSTLPQDILLYLSAFPPWSLASHFIVAAALLSLQQVVRKSRHFSIANEFLCTVLWVSWTLECYVIGFASSSLHALVVLFVRLLLGPILFQGAYVNPCNCVFAAVEERSGKKLPTYLLVQLVAMVTALVYSTLSWRFLSQWLSDIHQSFLDSRPNPFLQVPAWAGFSLELAMTFACFLPRLAMRQGFPCTFISALITCVLIFLLETTTGAFMNPLLAASSSLVWHSLSLREYLVHFVVYWVGPIAGSVLAARLALLGQAGEKERQD